MKAIATVVALALLRSPKRGCPAPLAGARACWAIAIATPALIRAPDAPNSA